MKQINTMLEMGEDTIEDSYICSVRYRASSGTCGAHVCRVVRMEVDEQVEVITGSWPCRKTTVEQEGSGTGNSYDRPVEVVAKQQLRLVVN